MYQTLLTLQESTRLWNFWVFTPIVCLFSLILSPEKKDASRTRLQYTLRLNSIYYVYEICAVIFAPITFKGDGRFYTFVLGANSLFILFFTTLLNPFFCRSTSFPQLEEMSPAKIMAFAGVEAGLYWFCSFLHLAWAYYLAEYNGFNRITGDVLQVARYVGAVCTAPAAMLAFNGLLQFLQRLFSVVRGTVLIPGEDQRSHREEERLARKLLRNQRRKDKLLEEVIKAKDQFHYQ